MDPDTGRRLAVATAAVALIACGSAATAPSAISTAASATATPLVITSSAPRAAPLGTPRPVRVGQPIVLDLPEDDRLAVAADDGALASVGRALDGATALHVTDLETAQRVTVATTPDRFVWLMPGGALRKDLVTYVEQEERGQSQGGGQRVTWHVMVANWRAGSPPTELDAIPGEIGPDPHLNNYLPAPTTNGHEVVWLRAPRADGRLGEVQVIRWSGGSSAALLAGEASYAIDDAGRIAVSRITDASTRTAELLLIESGAIRRVATRAQSGPSFLAGPKIVWGRLPSGPLAITTVDVVDIASGTMSPVTHSCPFVGATVRHVVYGCRDLGSRLVGVDDLRVLDLDDFFFRAEPHAIIGRDSDRWTVTRIAD